MEFVFQMKFSERILHRYLVYTKDLAKDQYVLMMPVFMVSLMMVQVRYPSVCLNVMKRIRTRA